METNMKKYTLDEIFDLYPTSTHYVAMLEIDSFTEDFECEVTGYVKVLEKTGEKEPNGSCIYKDNPLWFKETSFRSRKYVPCENPRKRNSK